MANRGTRRRWLWTTVWLAVGFGLLFETGRVLFGENRHTVLSGLVYRSAQPSVAALEEFAQLGGKTVVNLRGSCPQFAWYNCECETTHRLQLNQEDVCLSAVRLPPPAEVRRLIEILDRAEYPLLIHCRRGADRTGLACTLALLLHTDATLSRARWQLSLRYGHVGIGSAYAPDEFFDLYARWLSQQEKSHSPDLLRRFVRDDYCPGDCRADLVRLKAEDRVKAEVPSRVQVKAINRCGRDWHFKPGTGHGIHARFLVAGERGDFLRVGRAGLFAATVPPGEAINLDLALPALPAGRYCVHVDMIDSRGNSFVQAGSEPLMWELHAE